MDRQQLKIAYENICEEHCLTFEEKKEMVSQFLQDEEMTKKIIASSSEAELSCIVLKELSNMVVNGLNGVNLTK
jgi:hypothetical protein